MDKTAHLFGHFVGYSVNYCAGNFEKMNNSKIALAFSYEAWYSKQDEGVSDPKRSLAPIFYLRSSQNVV